MSVLKTQCPECDAKLRLSVDGEGEHGVECPKCGHSFTATLESDEPPVKAKKSAKSGTSETGLKGKLNTSKGSKKSKALKRRDEDEDDDDEDEEDDDRPRRKKKGAKDEGGKSKLIIAGVVAGVLALAGVGGIIYAVTSKDKPAKNDTTADAKPNVPAPVAGPNAAAPGPKPIPNTNPTPNTVPNTGTGPKPPGGPVVGPKPKPKDEQAELATSLPPPPRIRISGSIAPTDKPVVRAPAIPPLAPDEDPFVRAKEFKPDGPLPTLPKLADRGVRPILSLDANGHTAFLSKVFFAPKGDRIITVAEDKAVRFWDTTTSETVKTVRFPAGPGDEGSLEAAAPSRSGKRLAVAGLPVKNVQSGRVPIYILNPETGAPIGAPLELGSAGVMSLHFSNDGNKLALGCTNGVIQLIDVPGRREIDKAQVSKAHIEEVKFNPNPKANILATLGADGFVQLWNFSNSSLNRDFPIKGSRPKSLAWSSDGLFLAVGGTNGVITLCTLDGKIYKTLPPINVSGKPVLIYQLQFMPGDRELAVVGSGPFAGIVDSNTGEVRTSCSAHTDSVFAVEVSADGRQIASGGGNQHETLVWDADTGKVLHKFAGGGNGVWSVAWSKDGKSIAWGNTKRLDADTKEIPLEHTFRLDEFGLGNPPDSSKYVQVVKSDEGVGLMYDSKKFLVATPGRDPRLISMAGETIYSATLLPKGNAVVVGGATNLYLMNPATLQGTRTYTGHTGNVLCVTPSPDGRYFATGSTDQTIRIWQRDQTEPLLSIFVAGRDWIAWTTQGYYACSGQGERLIAWQVNVAGSKVPLVHPAARFRSSLYQPAMLKYLVPAGDLPRAMAMALKYDKKRVEITSVADMLPPEVTLEGFGETEVKLDKDKDTISVKASAKSAKHPITAMRLLVDGRPFQGSAGVKKFETPQNEAAATWDVPLTPGTHTFAVIADSPVSKGMSKIGIVFRPGTPPKPNLYVLAMGVSDYPGDMKLHYCASDAELLAKTFQEKSKEVFAKIEVKVLTDKAVTKKGMMAGLDWLKSKMTPQDVGIVTFSGHGTRDPFGKFYLVPVDFDGEDPDHTGFAGEVFKDRLDNMPGRLVAILDACHSGSVAEKNKPPAQADSLVRDLTAEDSGVIVMCASLGREYAIESSLTKAGFYTLGLVEGLSGYGDIDGDGLVYIHELDIYATTRVRQLSGGMQNPTLGRPPTVRPFPLAKVTKPVP